MAMVDRTEIQSDIIIFRRSDVIHNLWYCRLKIPEQNRYKFISLETPDMTLARDKAISEYAELQFKVKYHLPLFVPTFGEMVDEHLEAEILREKGKAISKSRLDTLKGFSKHLKAYRGTKPITEVNEDDWVGYPIWRRANGKGRFEGGVISDWTIRGEMKLFRSVMYRAVKKKLMPETSAMFRARLKLKETRREAFPLPEYRKLHTYARETWIKEAPNEWSKWHRVMVYNFILVMSNTGMRPVEAKNLRWGDIGEVRQHKETGMQFLPIDVHGKDKERELVCPLYVRDYLDRIKKISKATGPADFVFTTFEGKPAKTLYKRLIREVMTKAGVYLSKKGKPRSTYSFRHTYATLRRMNDADTHDVADNMGTSPLTLKKHYSHVKSRDAAHRILKGMHAEDAKKPRAKPRGAKSAGKKPRPGSGRPGARARTR